MKLFAKLRKKEQTADQPLFDPMREDDIFAKVRRIEIKTRGLAGSLFAGQYHSAFKGRGMTFSEVREYQYGDDIRDIEWNVTARFHRPYVKVFEEDRELTVMLLIDVSASLNFGTRTQTKRDQQTLIAATIAFSAIQNNDKIGCIFFSDKVEKFIPPKKGRRHILCIIREMLNFKASSHKTDVSAALQYFAQMQKRRCTAFVISDFFDQKSFLKPLQTCRSRHDVVAMQVYDPLLENLPDVGIMRVQDAETGHETYIDTSSKNLRRQHHERWLKRQGEVVQTFRRSDVDFVSVSTDGDFVVALRKLFAMRG